MRLKPLDGSIAPHAFIDSDQRWEVFILSRWSAMIFALSLIFSPSLAAAEDTAASQLTREFVGYCLQTLPDTKRVEAAARVMGWKELDRDLAALAAPKDKSVPWQGWFAETAPSPFFITVSQSEFRGRPMTACSISSSLATVSELLDALARVLPLGRSLGDFTELGQRSRVWEAALGDKQAIIVVTDAEKVGVPGFMIAAMVSR